VLRANVDGALSAWRHRAATGTLSVPAPHVIIEPLEQPTAAFTPPDATATGDDRREPSE